MAVGDDASTAGYPLVPDTGEEGRVRWGARELNRTRDFIAQLKALVPANMGEYRAISKISYGVGVPTPPDGVDGEIWFQVL
jgi:hypothetical protein